MSDIWDDPELAGAMAGGDFVSFKEPNTVVGTFLSIDPKGGTDFNGNVCPLVVMETDDGETRKITVGQANLKAKLWEAKPRPGDRCAIGWDGATEKVDKGEMKIFTVEVKRAETVAAEKPTSLL
jgi:hypothetical protein